jgi:nucleotide-binding universal stress UspA family protein
MARLLVAVDGSECSLRALAHAIDVARRGGTEIEALNVQIPIMSGHVREFVSQSMIDQYHRSEGEVALAPAVRLLNESGVPYNASMVVGHIAETIVAEAAKRHCDAIVMGTHGMGGMRNIFLGSVAMRVIHAADRPVTLIK